MSRDVADRLIREALGEAEPEADDGSRSERIVVYVAAALAGWLLVMVAVRLVWVWVMR